MALIPIGIALVPIFIAVLLGPLLVKKIERNLEAFLFLMGACAVAVSRSWHIGLVEEAVGQPAVVGIVLSILVAGLAAHHWRPHFLMNINDILWEGITMKVIILETVVVLGLSAAIVTPILPFFVLVETVNHLPLVRRTRANVTLLGCVSILLGASLALMEGTSSLIVATRMQGAFPSADFLPVGMQSLYIMLSILTLGFISIFLVGEKINAEETRISEKVASHKDMAIWSARASMFAGALLLIGIGVSI